TTHVYLISLTNPSPPYIYTLSLHDALPISKIELQNLQTEDIIVLGTDQFGLGIVHPGLGLAIIKGVQHAVLIALPGIVHGQFTRSEEHTSELQSRENLVCRLLLEKKKQQSN